MAAPILKRWPKESHEDQRNNIFTLRSFSPPLLAARGWWKDAWREVPVRLIGATRRECQGISLSRRGHGARIMTSPTTGPFSSTQLSKLAVISVTCLCAFMALALAVAHGNGPYGFEDPVFRWLGAPSMTSAWANFSEVLPGPTIGAALVISVTLGIARWNLLRVVVYAAMAAMAFLIS